MVAGGSRHMWQIGRIGGAPVTAHALWLIGVPLLGVIFALIQPVGPLDRLIVMLQPLTWALAVLLHECGHVAAARLFGAPVLGVALLPMGGATSFGRELRPGREELWISIAGPATSLALVLPAALLAVITEGTARSFGQSLMLFNAGVFFVNALPALPLDGGRAVRGLIQLRGHDHARATLFVNRLGVASGYALGGLAAVTLLLPIVQAVAVTIAVVLFATGALLVRWGRPRARLATERE